MYKITYADRFLKSFIKLTNIEQLTFERKMKIFFENNLHPSLRTKKIQGQKELFDIM